MSCTRATLVPALLSLALVACADAPDARVLAAWEAADLEEQDRFLGYFTTQSADLLRGIAATKARTRGGLTYLDSVYDALPTGEVVEVKERGNMALVTVKAKRKRFDIRLLHERGEWQIDALALPHFWEPLTKAGDE